MHYLKPTCRGVELGTSLCPWTVRTNLVHELHPVCQQYTAASLDFISLEELGPLVFSMSPLKGKSIEDVLLFLGDLRGVRCTVVNIAQDLESFFVAAHLVKISG